MNLNQIPNKFFIFIFLINGSNISSQIDSSYNINFESKGLIFNLYSTSLTNDLYQSNFEEESKTKNYEINIDFSLWKFSKRLLTGAFLNSKAYYYEYNNPLSEDQINYAKIRQIYGEIFTGLEYYPFKNNFYSMLTIGSSFYSRSVDNSQYVSVDPGSGKGSANYIWVGLGFGRIINIQRASIEFNFENVLREEKYIKNVLPFNIRKKLVELLEKRNDKDFISKYRDNNEVEFFEQIENLLLKERIISRSLNAKTTMRLYQTLTNPKFLYYPSFSGSQLQLDIQYGLNAGNYQNFITLGGIIGKLLNQNSQLLFSGFLTFPLSTEANISGLFKFTKNPFNNYLPVLFQRYQLQKNSYLNPRLYLLDTNRNQSYFLGGKIIYFKSFNSFIGIRPYSEFIFNKTNLTTENILSSTGIGIDYNLFSRLSFNLLAEINITNKYKPKYYYSIGFFLNIL